MMPVLLFPVFNLKRVPVSFKKKITVLILNIIKSINSVLHINTEKKCGESHFKS